MGSMGQQVRPDVDGDWIAIHALLATLSARGLHDAERTVEVGALSRRVAGALALDDTERGEVEELVALHDLGLIGMPDELMHKAGPLDDAERQLLVEQPRIGAAIVRSLDTLGHLAPLVESEHERWDGLGYPAGLLGDEIPLPSRIVLACDAYAAMLRPRPDRPALGPEVALAVLERNAGTQFCPTTVAALVAVLREPEPEPMRQPEPEPPAGPSDLHIPAGAAADRAPAPAAPAERAVLRRRPAEPLPPVAVAERPTFRKGLPRSTYLLVAVAATVLGAWLALPLPSAAGKCPPAGEGLGMCQLQKVWLITFVRIELVMVGALLLTWGAFVGIPRLVRGEYKEPPRPWPDGSDPVLAAASWTVTRPGAKR
jgi:hypothetical protein